MSRGAGRKGTPRQNAVERLVSDLLGGDGRELTDGERRELGIGDDRDIPGGLSHIANPETTPPPAYGKPAEWRFRKDLAHGVNPDEAGHIDRDLYEQHDRPGYQRGGRAPLHEDVPKPLPVPVYITERAGEGDSIRTASPRSITCPASTSAEPARVCGSNADRIEIMLLNEDTATDIRFGHDLAALSAGTGALLPWPNNSYLRMATQDELYAIGATGTGTPRLSIIEVFQGERTGN